VTGTLFGKGAVNTLDGEAHRVRKAMVVALLMDAGGIAALVERAEAAGDDAVPGWAARDEVVLHEEAARVLARAVCGWSTASCTAATCGRTPTRSAPSGSSTGRSARST
jgi:fatty-acid peroxygenase